MHIEEILSRLSKVKRGPRGWYCLCPSHRDRKRSLSVGEIDGKILIKCFAGCDIRDIVSDLGIEMKDLFAESAKSFRAEPMPSKNKIADIYDYTDEKGKLLF